MTQTPPLAGKVVIAVAGTGDTTHWPDCIGYALLAGTMGQALRMSLVSFRSLHTATSHALLAFLHL